MKLIVAAMVKLNEHFQALEEQKSYDIPHAHEMEKEWMVMMRLYLESCTHKVECKRKERPLFVERGRKAGKSGHLLDLFFHAKSFVELSFALEFGGIFPVLFFG
jgi:hypothetical protein